MKSVRALFVLATAATLVGSLWLGYQLRFDFSVPADVAHVALLASLWVVSLKLFGLWRFRQFQVLLKYFSISDFTGLFWLGKLVEFNPTEKIFTQPDEQQTEDYVTGRFG